VQGTPQPQHGPRLIGAVATARSERVAVFKASVDRRDSGTDRPSLAPGRNVIVAVGGHGHKPMLVELGPMSALRLAAALLAASRDPQNGG
jgi:hypothetical protein